MIILYSNHCVKCDIVKAKLEAKKIEYTLVDDEAILTSKGFDWMPVIELDDGTQLTSLIDINNYINEQ